MARHRWRNPFARAQKRASALASVSPSSAATFFSSTRFAPLVITSTERPIVALLKTMLLAICVTSQWSRTAALAVVRPGFSCSIIAAPEPLAGGHCCTFCADGDSADIRPTIQRILLAQPLRRVQRTTVI